MPKSPWVFVAVVAVAIAISVVVMMLASGAQERQANVIAVHDCVSSVAAAIDHNTKVLDEERAAAAAPCFEQIAPIGEATPDTLVPGIKSTLASVRRLHQEGQGKTKAEVNETLKLLDEIDEFNRWYIQNRARYAIH
ncbi:MAG: hypothetical protein EP329_14415 [Deltaproteobacteria bacterium]|nr:MAG: hypothetical protein EP329_14415 [Deltaproteobacteria bacterium]